MLHSRIQHVHKGKGGAISCCLCVESQAGSCCTAAYGSCQQLELVLQEPVEQTPVVPLSERFRLAYVSRAERVAAKAERNYQQRRRRELRNNTVLQALAKFNYL